MGLEKAGIKIITAWAKTGEKTLLATRPVKVNTKSLGYIHPNGEISFQSSDSALNYAKNQVMEALKSKKPYEKAVIVKDNMIKGVSIGNENHVELPHISTEKCTIIHGHPAGKNNSPPISFQDGQQILGIYSKYDAVVAYNTAGEYSYLKRLPISSAPQKTQFGKVEDLNKSSTSKTDHKIISNTKVSLKLQETSRRREEFINFILGKKIKEYHKAIECGDKELIKKLLLDAQDSPEGILKIHQFWMKFANKYGLEYKTNYSYLP